MALSGKQVRVSAESKSFCSTLSRPWNAYDAYLFDIDGTLLTCTDAVHYYAFCAVLEQIAGRHLGLDGVVAHGNTDIGILRDALERAQVPDAAWRPRLPWIRTFMGDYVGQRRAEICARTLPGVVQVLEHLRSRGALLAVATGNLERIGRLKLEACGLLDYFQFGGYSDGFENRADVVGAALERIHSIAGAAAAVCLVGDTPADVLAANHHGLDVIAVATGIYTADQLLAAAPGACVSSLEDLLSTA
jgi:phosphoglycolate phosphatase